jgi:hypothetical protein
MSRNVITAVVGTVIVVLTAIAYFVTSSSFADHARKTADAQLGRAHQVVQRLTALQGIDVRNKAERLAAREEFVRALRSSSDRGSEARQGFLQFTSDPEQGAIKPDIIALVDENGDVVAMYDVPTIVPKQWRAAGDDPKHKSIIPALNHVIVTRQNIVISDIWKNGDQMLKLGVAPVIETDGDKKGEMIGAIVVAYAQTAKNAAQDRSLLGTEIAYYDAKAAANKDSKERQVLASSFPDTGKDRAIAERLSTDLTELGAKKRVTIDGVDYLAATASIPRLSNVKLNSDELAKSDYPPVSAGAVLLAPIDDPTTNSGTVKTLILLLGLGALAMAMLGLYLSHRRMIAQVDSIEIGVIDIINGNLDRTFRPVGPELDGLANGLNVMLARLLGRPEPGEEEFDEEGNPIMTGRVEFDEGEERPAPDPDLAALAQESEPDYYKRVYTEYVAARKATGAPDEVSFENFIAKLKVNEGKLKAQYNCRAVRFRVVTKDGKVSLKPVPIYA